MSAAAMPAPDGQRVAYFDWLRVAAVLGVVVYHALQPFGSIGWFISNDEVSPVLTVLLTALSSFGLPVLFLIAGASVRFALRKRSPRAFLVERAQRLLVPFAIGAVLFGPVNGYTIGVFNGTVSQSFIEYVLAYPGMVIAFQLANPGLSRLLLVAVHLWFLGALFLFSAVGLPLFTALSSTAGRSLLNALWRLVRWPAATLLFAVPATVPIYVFFASTLQPQLWDSWSLGWFAVIFLAGYVIYSDDRLVSAVRRDFVPALIVALMGTAGLGLSGFAAWSAQPQSYGPTYVVMITLFGVTGWAWAVALLGLAMRVPAWRLRLPAAVGEAALPLYILHLPIVMTISAFVVRSSFDLGTKATLSVVLGVVASVVVAGAAVRVAFLRPLLGVRPSRSDAAGSPARTGAAPAARTMWIA